jgi:outer membrane protein assembly factor BamD (BamD/ComL family)
MASLEADFYIAECSYALGDYETAIEHYRKVYRRGSARDAMLQRTFDQVYAIALDYIYGRAGQYLLIPLLMVRGPGYGIDLLTAVEAGNEGLLTEFPYLDFADDALMEIGSYHYDIEEDFDAAERVYRRVVLEYPNRDQRELAQYRLAMSIYRQIRGTAFEQEFMVNAERAFRRYLEDYPRGKNSEEARAKLRELTDLQGKSYLEKAKFYLRESQLVAARMYLRVVLERYTTTDAAREAKDIMSRIDRVEAEG